MAKYLLLPKQKEPVIYTAADGKKYLLTPKKAEPVIYETLPAFKPKARGNKYVFGRAYTFA